LLRNDRVVSIKDVGQILAPLFVKQFRFRLPVKPTKIEGAVRVADHVLSQEAALPELIADRFRLEPLRVGHSRWRDLPHFLVTECRVEVPLEAPEKHVQINGNQKIISASLDAREGDRDEIGQAWPFRIMCAHHGTLERKSKC
jgi:hypothetical protein